MKTRIALCQLDITASVHENLRIIEDTLSGCAIKGVNLCVFPEDFLYGILKNRINVEIAARKFSSWTHIFCSLAKKYKVDVIPGSFPSYENGSLYNTTVYINSNGKLVNKHRKTNLWLSERSEYTASVYEPQCFKSVLGKTLLIICWDIMDHKLFRTAVEQHAEWVIIISLWSVNQSTDLTQERGKPLGKYAGNVDSKLIDNLIFSRANEYNIGIIFCNFAKSLRYRNKYGFYSHAISAGHTQIATPLSQISKKINGRKADILICDIPNIKQFITDHEILYGRREDILASVGA